MTNQTFTVVFDIKGVRDELLKRLMEQELIRVYNIYADRTNGGVTEALNEEFSRLNPHYFEDNAGKEWYDLTEYNRFMADGYQKRIVDDLNRACASNLLTFYVSPREVNFMGHLRWDRNATIEFYLK